VNRVYVLSHIETEMCDYLRHAIRIKELSEHKKVPNWARSKRKERRHWKWWLNVL